MEIATTMVRFTVKADDMKNQSDKAVQICQPREEGNLSEWVPLRKIDWVKSDTHLEFNCVIMPKWVFMKGCLPMFIRGTVEFIYRINVTEEELFDASYELRNIIR